uniref:NADH dehydrogenase subunit 3 n=1 Tax=Phyllosticta yuccae TaxID=1151444 RepID=UPI0027A9FCF0|nr:NADH dehydrogenase subunit 3 [Phyllosticta yuccae]WGC90045.1 NADH dehydrogenase subunit 3 [Phyllosticta yuccae]
MYCYSFNRNFLPFIRYYLTIIICIFTFYYFPRYGNGCVSNHLIIINIYLKITFFITFIGILCFILLLINLILAPHTPYEEKDSAFECGFHSFYQTRNTFNISFFIFGLLFLLFDLEILLVYPYVVSAYFNNIYGLMLMVIFFLVLTLGFAFEIGKGALKIESRQNDS